MVVMCNEELCLTHANLPKVRKLVGSLHKAKRMPCTFIDKNQRAAKYQPESCKENRQMWRAKIIAHFGEPRSELVGEELVCGLRVSAPTLQ